MFNEVLEKAKRASNEKAKENSYLADNGLLYCLTCKTPKQIKIKSPFDENKLDVVGISCRCESEKKANEEEKRKAEIKANKIFVNRENCFSNDNFKSWTFEKNLDQDNKTTEACKRYVDKFSEMKKQNIGMLLYGNFGTGKTFHACNIANALLDKTYRVYMANIVELIAYMQDFNKRDIYQAKIETYDLLVIDDIGAERNSSYGLEQLYNIIDTRYRAGLPTVFTTNLTLEEIQNPTDTAYKRIYDRVDEMTPIKIKLAGTSKRKEKRDTKRQLALSILYDE